MVDAVAAGQSPMTSNSAVLAPEKLNRPSSGEATLPTHNNDIEASKPKGKLRIKHAGESGRAGFHPFHFFKITWRSSSRASKLCNIFWPVVPAAIAVNYARPDLHVVIFTLAYIAMVPCANLIGFAGQELARKFSHVFGVLLETTFGSVVEIILFMVLLSQDQFRVIQAAILGSILATMLLCLGLCFFVGGLKRDEQTFNDAISEAGSGLLLTAGVALAVPAIYDRSLRGSGEITDEQVTNDTLGISRGIAVLLLISYAVYVFFQARTHHGVYDAVFKHDEARDKDRQKELNKDKLTMTECIIALAISITLVTLIAIALVEQIDAIKERGVSDPFLGLILVPLVEKAAEHLTAVDEAWDDQMNLALSHVLGSTLQTALLNAPLVVIVAWGKKQELALNFEIFDVIMLILAIVTVGNFLRDQKSNYLEGFLCVIVYVAIAVAAFYYPNPHSSEATTEGGNGTTTGDPAAETAAVVVEHLLGLRR